MNEATNALVLGTEEQKELDREVSIFEQKANEIEVKTESALDCAAVWTKQVKALKKKAEEYWDPMRVATYNAYQTVLAHKKQMTEPMAKAEKILKGEVYAESLKKWTAENISQIKSIPSETLGNLEQTILNGYRSGATIGQMKKEIQSEYDVSKRKAELLARDQVATLNAQVTKMQQTDAGVKRYKWSSSNDSRVRDCHKALNGQTFSWDDPPEMWYMTKTKGKVFTGRRCHPGEDYCCRCVALPIFDWETVDVPMDGGE
ncbi:MAG: minor capsid protein [Clostridiales bacterium]|nr:minor capsid protein [Clostridiales bacterium]